MLKLIDAIKEIHQYSKVRYWYRHIRGLIVYNNKVLRINTIKRRGWMDCDHILLHASFQVLQNFIDGECGVHGSVDWSADTKHENAMKTMLDLVDWWNNDPFAQDFGWMPDDLNASSTPEEVIALFTAAYKDPSKAAWIGGVVRRALKDKTHRSFDGPYYLATLIENKALSRQQQALKRLIDIRPFLWT